MSMTENVKKTGLHLCHLLCYTHKRRARLLTMLLGRESEFQTLFSCIKSNDSNNFMERIIMLKIKEYTKVESLEEAYQLNQKRTACLIGGMVWLKMGNRNVSMAIDLSGLGLDTIEEDENEFRIGCMTSLRSLELHKGLADYTNGAMRESVRHIVGVQFRNCATVGGSIFGRYGFSDVLTMFLAMDSYVELYKGGIIPMKEFSQMKKDRDILVRIIVKKVPMHTVYLSQRNSATDFPVLTCAVGLEEKKVRIVIGARPQKAMLIEKELESSFKFKVEEVEALAEEVQKLVPTGSNMRASAEYRSHLVKVLTKRALVQVEGDANEK